MQKSSKTLEVGAQNYGRRKGSKDIMISKFLPLVGITVIMTLLIVWEQVQTTKYSYEVAKLQKKATDLQEKNRRLECQVNALKKPERVVNAIQSIGLDLAQPLENVDRIAKTKQRNPSPKNGQSTKTIVASAKRELEPLGRGKEVKRKRSEGVKR